MDIQDIDKINLAIATFKDNLLAIIIYNHISVLPLEGFANYNYNNNIEIFPMVGKRWPTELTTTVTGGI